MKFWGSHTAVFQVLTRTERYACASLGAIACELACTYESLGANLHANLHRGGASLSESFISKLHTHYESFIPKFHTLIDFDRGTNY